MDSLLTPVDLNRETTQALDEIRSGAENALYGANSAQAEERIYRSVLPLIEGAGLPSVHVIHYRWFLREVARHWRMRKDRDLAFHLELCIRKWINLGLEPRTLQFLICEAHQRLKGKSEGRSAHCQTGTAEVNDECRTQSAESVKSVDVLSDTTSAESADVQSLDTAFLPVESDDTTAKDAKTAKAEPDSAAVTEQSAESVEGS